MITLRSLADADRAWALPQILAFVAAQRPYSPLLNLQEDPFYARFFDGDGWVIGAWRGEALLGFVLLGGRPFLEPLWTPLIARMGLDAARCGVVVHILVGHRERGLGLGVRLMTAACSLAWSQRLRTLFATCHPDNTAVLQLFDRFGLAPQETRVVYRAAVKRALLAGRLRPPAPPSDSPVCHLPTPVEPLPRLSRALGGPEIFVKRDDLTGLATGGNKARMLRLFLRDALERGARTLVTRGSPVSNHCRQTAAAARAGLRCELVIRGYPPPALAGNLYLAHLMGAKLTWTEGRDADAVLAAVQQRLTDEGQAPYAICYGGAHPFGALSYAEAVQELEAQQLGAFDHFVVATSSGATQAGLLAGCLLHRYPARVLGVSVDEPAAPTRANILRLVREVARLYGDPPLSIPEDQVQVCDRHIGPGYAIVSPLERHAIDLLAREEGLLLDPVYTARAMGGLMSAVERGELRAGHRVLFWHTGGLPSLFELSTAVLDA